MTEKEQSKVERRCLEVVRQHGAVLLSDTEQLHELETEIGKVRIAPEIKNTSGVMSLYVTFHEKPDTARQIFPHWKVNLQMYEREDFHLHVDAHLQQIKEKIDLYTLL